MVGLKINDCNIDWGHTRVDLWEIHETGVNKNMTRGALGIVSVGYLIHKFVVEVWNVEFFETSCCLGYIS